MRSLSRFTTAPPPLSYFFLFVALFPSFVAVAAAGKSKMAVLVLLREGCEVGRKQKTRNSRLVADELTTKLVPHFRMFTYLPTSPSLAVQSRNGVRCVCATILYEEDRRRRCGRGRRSLYCTTWRWWWTDSCETLAEIKPASLRMRGAGLASRRRRRPLKMNVTDPKKVCPNLLQSFPSLPGDKV